MHFIVDSLVRIACNDLKQSDSIVGIEIESFVASVYGHPSVYHDALTAVLQSQFQLSLSHEPSSRPSPADPPLAQAAATLSSLLPLLHPSPPSLVPSFAST